MTALGLLLVGVGGVLGWSGFTGRTPIELLTGTDSSPDQFEGFSDDARARLQQGVIISGGAPALPTLPGVNAPLYPTPTGAAPPPAAPVRGLRS